MKQMINLNSWGRATVILLFLLMSSPAIWLSAQDMDRMNRDVKVMQQALNELFSEEMGTGARSFYGPNEQQARYVPGFGIMLYVPNIPSQVIQTEEGELQNFSHVQTQNWQEKSGKIAEVMKQFLADYGDLARQLPAGEQIMVHYKESGVDRLVYVTGRQALRGSSNSVQVTDRGNGNRQAEITAKVSRADISAYREGKINRDQFEDKISVVTLDMTTKEGGDPAGGEFQVFAGILKSLYEGESDEMGFNYSFTFPQHNGVIADVQWEEEDDEEMEGAADIDVDAYVSQSMFAHKTAFRDRVQYNRIAGFGVIYELKLGYPLKRISEEEEGEWKDLRDEYLEKRDDKIEEIYQHLLPEMKEHMIEYGRTLRGLEGGEMLVVEVELPACQACDLPAKLEFKVKQSVLSDYDRGKISLEQAMTQVMVAEQGKARELEDLKLMMQGKSMRFFVPRPSVNIDRRYRDE